MGSEMCIRDRPSVVSAKLMFTLLSQLSVAITFTVAADGNASPQPAIISAGTPVKTGAVLSSTVMICVASDSLPQASIAFQVLTNT